jgi:hypothetical protein
MSNKVDYNTPAHKGHWISGSFSNPATPDEIAQAVKDGMIPMSELKDGQWYAGHCRNASKAQWKAEAKEFSYWRYKFGNYFLDTANHIEEDNGFDCFIPVAETTPETKHLEAKDESDKG